MDRDAIVEGDRSYDRSQYVLVRSSWTLHKVGPSAMSVPNACVDFADRMQRARVSSKLTLQQLAQLCFVPAAQLASFERNEDAPSETVMRFILKTCEDHRNTSEARER